MSTTDIDGLLTETAERKASDLHLAVGISPMIRVSGELVALDYPSLGPAELKTLITGILDDEQKDQLKRDLELDFSYSVGGVARFRGNAMVQRGTLAAVFRVVPFGVPSIDDLGLPPQLRDVCYSPRGLVLVTGPTGSGKSTTIAAMIDHINTERRVNIVTIEDPIEFLHRHKNSVIKQREVGIDTRSYAAALKHVLRQDPDVIFIGEMRDLESISIAITAAETGHLVLSTLHTQTAPLTITRIVDAFDGSARDQIRQQLANSLRAIVSQQLIPHKSGKGRVAAVELMLDTPAIRNMIRDGKEHQLYSAILTGKNLGMQTMDQALAQLVTKGSIEREAALDYCIDKIELNRLMGKTGRVGLY